MALNRTIAITIANRLNESAPISFDFNGQPEAFEFILRNILSGMQLREIRKSVFIFKGLSVTGFLSGSADDFDAEIKRLASLMFAL